MKDVIFREYDIRGKVGSDFIVDQVYSLTQAIAFYFLQQNPQLKTIAVGMDGRTHSPAIKEQLCRALQEGGINVIFVGTCPSPALYFALHNLPVDAGLMITASHNTKEYNGIKICLGKRSVYGDAIRAIRDLYQAGIKIEADNEGTYKEHPIIPDYVKWLVKHFKHLQGMKTAVIIDCANGAAGTVMPQLIEKMKWPYVQLLYPEVDGTYPNHEADPVVEENMMEVKRILATTDMQLGIGLDGDCDRMAAMTKSGTLIAGDQLLAIFAADMAEQHDPLKVVFDIKCSSGLIEVLQKIGATPVMSATGHAIIKNTMRKNEALLGGELSCHFIFKDRYFGYDDGIYATLRLFEILQKTGKTLEQLLEIFPTKYSSLEYRIACNEKEKKAIIDHIKTVFSHRKDVDMITVDGVRVSFDNGWGIVRASNTQPVMSMRFESDTWQGLHRIKQEFIDALKPFYNQDVLKKELGVRELS